jgi:hypothetical protein
MTKLDKSGGPKLGVKFLIVSMTTTSSTNPSDHEPIAASRQILPADRGDQWQSGRSHIGVGKRNVEKPPASVQINAHAKKLRLNHRPPWRANPGTGPS